MPEIASSSIDVVVSVSALEHNSLANLNRCVNELLRILKPGGRLIATLAASEMKDWFHEPSEGWCLTEKTIKDIFALNNTRSNFHEYKLILEEIKNCRELKDF